MRAFLFVPLITIASLAGCNAAELRIDSANGSVDAFSGRQQGTTGVSDDLQFLKALADHREGMMQFALATMNHTSREMTRVDAQQLHMRQLAERDSVLRTLTTFDADYAPVVQPRYKALADSVTTRSGEARDAAFYRFSALLLREGLRLLETHTPALRDDHVRALAERSTSEHETALLRLTTRRR